MEIYEHIAVNWYFVVQLIPVVMAELLFSEIGIVIVCVVVTKLTMSAKKSKMIQVSDYLLPLCDTRLYGQHTKR